MSRRKTSPFCVPQNIADFGQPGNIANSWKDRSPH